MKYSKAVKKAVALFVLTAVVITVFPQVSLLALSDTDLNSDDPYSVINTYSVDPSVPSYAEYVSSHESVYPHKTISVTSSDICRYEKAGISTSPELYSDYEGFSGESIYTGEEDIIEFSFKVEESGFYYPRLRYYPVEGKTSEIQRAFFIDGELPYEELSLIKFNRIWQTDISGTYVDDQGITVKEWKTDNQGFQVKPESVEAPEWCERFFFDSNGYITSPLAVYLEAGEHTLTMIAQKEPVLIGSLEFTYKDELKAYSDYLAGNSGLPDTPGQFIRIEAENASKMSSQMLYPRQDQSSPLVYPSSPKLLLNNTIGGTSWQSAGQWIEWEFDAPEDGYYNISAYCKQNFVRGIDVCRKIYIDGEVPFEEMSDYGFGYSQSWREEILSDREGNPYSFYLAKGHHTIRMEVVLGDMAEVISSVQDTVQLLNGIYRSVIYITGVSP
nr:ABC transporter substrate-binding protein [Lachnospiraceae bacterium]